MRIEILCMALAVTFLAQISAPGQDEQQHFMGTWDIKALNYDGHKTPPQVLEGSKLLFQGEKRFSFRVGPLTTMHGLFEFGPAAELKPIDLLPTSGVHKGKRLAGIYKLEDGQMKIAYSEPGEPRPSDFASESGSKITLMTLEKAVH